MQAILDYMFYLVKREKLADSAEPFDHSTVIVETDLFLL